MGKQLFLLAYPISQARIYERRQEDLSVTRVEGVRVLQARQFRVRRLIVECHRLAYKVRKSIGDRWDLELMTTFVVSLAHSAGC